MTTNRKNDAVKPSDKARKKLRITREIVKDLEAPTRKEREVRGGGSRSIYTVTLTE